ncbi:MAG: hypothetical protein IKQ33_01630 [Clostridia bacterium]|nr:hypothetical protein [Clostridia bacterium]
MNELSEKEKEAVRRCEYACNKFRENHIPHVVKKQEIGHINLLANVDGKLLAVMSFWARTGKFIFLRIPKNKIVITSDNDRGLNNCIDAYLKFFGAEDK